MEIFRTEKGRPTEKRGETEEKIYDFLEALQVEYTRADHLPAATMEDCEEVGKALSCKLCKNLFLCDRTKRHFYLLMLPGDAHFLTKELSKQIGSSRLSFAPEENMVALLHCHPGSAGLLSLIFDEEKTVELLIDDRIMEGKYISCHVGKNTSSVRLEKSDVFEKILPAMGRSARHVALTN